MPTPLDPLISLALTIENEPKRHALMLGSGVSRSAGIPTGWDVTTRLVEKLATASGYSGEESPMEWYQREYGEPNYSALLEGLFKSSSDRSQYMKAQVEPDDEERKEGLKSPTTAHRAIARLMKLGYISLVLTTNFDRLLEEALADEGITPLIIHSEATAESATLAHRDHVIIKLHGDYTDPDSLNTAQELSEYRPHMASVLERVLPDYGWIVCGWSGDYDHALREAFQRRGAHRHTVFWSHFGEPTQCAQDLITHLNATKVSITGADDFFGAVCERVEALASSYGEPIQSLQIKVALTKKYVADQVHRIRFYDLLTSERDAIVEAGKATIQWNVGSVGQARIHQVRDRLHGEAEAMCHILLHAAIWGDEETTASILELISSLDARLYSFDGGTLYGHWSGLARLPSVLAFYHVGIAYLIRRRGKELRQLLDLRLEKEPFKQPSERIPISNALCVEASIPVEKQRRYTPGSEYLLELMGESFTQYASKAEFERAFDLFQYLVAIEGTHQSRKPRIDQVSIYPPRPGRYGYKNTSRRRGSPKAHFDELLATNTKWLLDALGSEMNIEEAKGELDERVRGLNWG